MEILKKYEEQIIALQNKLDLMSNKTTSDEYAAVMARLMDLQDLYTRETERQKKEAEVAQEAKRLAQEDEKIALEAEKLQQNAEIEEKKLKAGRWATAKQIGLKIVGGIVTVGANALLMYGMIRMNNSGETLTSFEQKLLTTDKIKW